MPKVCFEILQQTNKQNDAYENTDETRLAKHGFLLKLGNEYMEVHYQILFCVCFWLSKINNF